MILLIISLSIIIISFLSTLTGLGGGILYLPIFVFLGYHIWEAASLSIFLSLVSSAIASIALANQVFLSRKKIMWLEVFSVAGAFLGGYACVYVDMDVLFLTYFTYSLTTVILYRSLLVQNRAVTLAPYNAYIQSIINLLTGILYGLTAVTGSSIKIPLFFRKYQLPYRSAIAFSALSIFLISVASLAGRIMNIGFDVYLGLYCSILVVIPVILGAYSSRRLPRNLIIDCTIFFQVIVIITNLALMVNFIYMHSANT